MTQYVCGFYFYHLLQRVALIEKKKPKWQAGKLNGIGGKIELREATIEAMRREFKEETGIYQNDWNSLIILYGQDWVVYFFYAVAQPQQFEYVQTMEEEEVFKIDINDLQNYDHISNLDFLIPMAINKIKFPDEEMRF
jgi:8-oxo-dGTP diphosphatase